MFISISSVLRNLFIWATAKWSKATWSFVISVFVFHRVSEIDDKSVALLLFRPLC
jgi:hypothetical protein